MIETVSTSKSDMEREMRKAKIETQKKRTENVKKISRNVIRHAIIQRKEQKL